jgi:hypothetical protein
MSNPQNLELHSIPPEYIYFKPKDIARMALSIASDINMTDPDSDKELTGILLQNKEFLEKFTQICDLINNCGKDVAKFLEI